jgi:spermidine/putrescine transport system permease protein
VSTSTVSRAAGADPDLWDRIISLFIKSEAVRGYTLLSPALIIMLLALAAPLFLLIIYSFWTQTGITVDTTFTLDRYREILVGDAAANYRTLFLRTLWISGIVTLVTVLIAYPMAYYVAFHVTRHKFVWLVLLTIPFWTSYLLRVFAWKVILGYNGVINSSLIQLGLITEPLEFLLYNPTAVVITLAHAYAAFAILPIYVSLEKIDRSILEAASDLGDGPWTRFWRVTLPLSFPGVIAAAVVIFVPTTGDFVTPSLVGGTTSVMIANVIQVQFAQVNDWPMGAALALSSIALVALIVVFVVGAARAAVGRIK